jgi:hypothetical protein
MTVDHESLGDRFVMRHRHRITVIVRPVSGNVDRSARSGDFLVAGFEQQSAKLKRAADRGAPTRRARQAAYGLRNCRCARTIVNDLPVGDDLIELRAGEIDQSHSDLAQSPALNRLDHVRIENSICCACRSTRSSSLFMLRATSMARTSFKSTCCGAPVAADAHAVSASIEPATPKSFHIFIDAVMGS